VDDVDWAETVILIVAAWLLITVSTVAVRLAQHLADWLVTRAGAPAPAPPDDSEGDDDDDE